MGAERAGRPGETTQQLWAHVGQHGPSNGGAVGADVVPRWGQLWTRRASLGLGLEAGLGKDDGSISMDQSKELYVCLSDFNLAHRKQMKSVNAEHAISITTASVVALTH